MAKEGATDVVGAGGAAVPRLPARHRRTTGLGLTEGHLNIQILHGAKMYPALKLMRNNSGARKGGKVRYGLGTGSADWIGCLRGRFFAIEAKKEDGVTSDAQMAWLAEIRAMGGFAAVVRSIEEFHQAVARAAKGESR